MESKIYIFGAHSRARTLAAYLQYLYLEVHIEAFLYLNEEPNPDRIEGIPVISLYDKNAILYPDYPVYIATRGVWHEQITAALEEKNFQKIYPVTVAFDIALRNQYLEKYFSHIHRDFIKIDRLQCGEKKKSGFAGTNAAVYVVRSHFDRPLARDYRSDVWEKEILAGAALADGTLSDDMQRDDRGENISARNRQFCELTALYWLWKNAKEEVVGLSHYRRHFLLPQNWTALMREYQIDVILPTPLYVAPGVGENYRQRHDSRDWDWLMEYLRRMDPQRYKSVEKFSAGNLYSPCNMLVTKKEVLNELCTWLFPILFAAAEHIGEKDDPYQNRYPGFMAERLITYFFEENSDIYNVAYADKNFLQ